eukprot:CAMPEP_0175041434 /NCGR_PEP_ID=MMETSP0052_2-20121109/1913_1 /TAXON_ID=51329 ORGANISM="Polytomella parva, Strain SAG 63-3" /NCGR_SAMPLE_ID=MMETSP0052_2 /ASSEMBLY_ACC=CAM_ASM_000194 /LENGTH=145 /DNA_ID=CAMNT_0016303949 /DNA_START=194 /DNA_END=631 /DNA_ORIENTATION=-
MKEWVSFTGAHRNLWLLSADVFSKYRDINRISREMMGGKTFVNLYNSKDVLSAMKHLLANQGDTVRFVLKYAARFKALFEHGALRDVFEEVSRDLRMSKAEDIAADFAALMARLAKRSVAEMKQIESMAATLIRAVKNYQNASSS